MQNNWSEVAQSCLTLCDPMDCSQPGSSVYGIFQARILEWVAISFSRVTSWPRDQTRVSHIVGRRFTVWATKSLIYKQMLGFPCGSVVKNLPALQEPLVMQAWSLGQGDPLEESMATHPSILAWRIPWMEESGGLQSMGLQRVRHHWSDLAHTQIDVSN